MARFGPQATATDLGIDELARDAGTTTRNVRALQTGGLLPRPRLQGRTGRYGRDHLERLRAVIRLQERGFSLAAIKILFDAHDSGATLEDVLATPRLAGWPARSPAEGVEDPGYGWFEDWPGRTSGRVLAVVPSDWAPSDWAPSDRSPSDWAEKDRAETPAAS